jgi:hypothetical protein
VSPRGREDLQTLRLADALQCFGGDRRAVRSMQVIATANDLPLHEASIPELPEPHLTRAARKQAGPQTQKRAKHVLVHARHL